MPFVKGKIKNLFSFISRAWSGGIYGKAGCILTAFALFFFIRMFTGTVSVQNFVINIWNLHTVEQQAAAEHAELDKINQHIKLLQSYSSDYVGELAQKHLNLGAPQAKILKI